MKRQREDLAIANDRNDAINEELAALPAPVVRVVPAQPKPVVESKDSIALRAQVAADRAELARLQARYTDRHPDVLKAQDDLAEAQRHFDSLPKPAPAPRPATVTVPPSAAELVVQERRSELMRERIQLEYQISAMKSDLEDEQAILNKLPKVSLPKPALPEPMTTVTPAVPVMDSIPSQPQTELTPLILPAKNITVVREGVSRADLLRALPLSALIGCLFSLMLLVCVEALDKTIKGPELLQELLPADVLYLGSVGRMRD